MKNLIACLLIGSAGFTYAQDWEDFADFGQVYNFEFVVTQSGRPVMAFTDAGGAITVEKWTGSSWSVLPQPNPNPISNINLATVNDIIYCGLFDEPTGIYLVYKYDGTSWTQLGDLSTTVNYNPYTIDLSVSDIVDDLTLGCSNGSDNVSVYRFQAGSWNVLPAENFCTLGSIPSLQEIVVANNGSQYFAANKEFDMAGAMPVYEPGIEGVPVSLTKSGLQPDVRMYSHDGVAAAWDWQGSQYIIDNTTDFDMDCLPGQLPVVAGLPGAFYDQIEVQRAVGGTYNAIPSYVNGGDGIYELSMQLNSSNQPVIVYTDNSIGPYWSHAIAFDGTSWNSVGPGISTSYIDQLQLNLAPLSNKPYVLFSNSGFIQMKTFNQTPVHITNSGGMNLCDGTSGMIMSNIQFNDADNDSVYLYITSTNSTLINNANITWNRTNVYSPGSDQNTFSITAFPTPGQTGTTLISVFATDGLDTLQIDFPIDVNMIPGLSAGSDQTLCTGTMTTLTAYNPDLASISWSNSVMDGVPFPATIAGVYTVTANLDGCVATDDLVINLNPTPPASLIYGDPITCGGADGYISFVMLNAFENYTVSYDDNGVPVTPYVATASGTGELSLGSHAAGSYSNFSISNAFGCNAFDGSTIVLVDPNAPTIDAGTNFSVCEGSPVTLTASNPDGASLAWSNGITDGVAFVPAATANYTVTATLNGCVSSDVINIALLPVPQATALGTPTLCGYENGSVDATISGGTPPYSIYWSNGATTEDISNLPPAMYYLNVKDINNCYSMTAAPVNVVEISINSVNWGVSCAGAEDGSIDLTVTGTGPFEYQWSNGATTEDLVNIPAGQYEVFVTNPNNCGSSATFVVGTPAAITGTFVPTTATCGTPDGAVNAVISGGTPSYNYVWKDGTGTVVGTNSSTLSGVMAGYYSLEVTDAIGCSVALFTSINNTGGPDLIATTNPSSCSNDGSVDVTVLSAAPIATYAWSSGENTEDLSGKAAGTYSVTATDLSGCVGTAVATVPHLRPDVLPICIVTVDTNTNTNLVVWQKPVVTNISHFNVYRESSIAGSYQFVDSVLYTEESLLNDTIAYPSLRSWRYKLTVVNECGVESELSDDHKTIHLVYHETSPGVFNLDWDNYEGFAYSDFHIWRHTLQNDWEEIAVLPFGTNSLTDTPPFVDEIDYMVEVFPPFICQSTNLKVQDHNSSRSNKSANIAFNNGDAGIAELDNNLIEIYPNPTSGIFWVNVDATQLDIQNVRVYDMAGNLIEKVVSHKEKGALVDLSGMENGVYLVQVQTAEGIYHQRVVKN